MPYPTNTPASATTFSLINPYTMVHDPSIQIDELQARYESAQPSREKQSHDYQDPLENRKGEKRKKRAKGYQEEDHQDAFKGKNANWFKQPGEKKTEELPEQSWFNGLFDADKN
ncbi:hypothetical protein Tco_0952201 [Tanacetum coccineum]|uniref:Uncharacterized protein n=1 Tax=Tanacetum coccineum TaxID=301880 RepID=A0ABQ5DZ53_9ASTR